MVDFSGLSKKQRELARYLYDRRGTTVFYKELLENVWPEYTDADSNSKRYRRLVQLTVQKTRKKLPVNWIRSCGSQGYLWVGTHGNCNGEARNVKEIILSSGKDLDSSVTIARMMRVVDTHIIQIRQTEGTKAQSVNLDLNEYEILGRFVALNL